MLIRVESVQCNCKLYSFFIGYTFVYEFQELVYVYFKDNQVFLSMVNVCQLLALLYKF